MRGITWQAIRYKPRRRRKAGSELGSTQLVPYQHIITYIHYLSVDGPPPHRPWMAGWLAVT